MATEKNTNAKISKSNALFRGVFFVSVVDIVQQTVGNLFANCLQAYLYFWGVFAHCTVCPHLCFAENIQKFSQRCKIFVTLSCSVIAE